MTKPYFNPAYARFVNPITGKSYRAQRSLRFGSAAFKSDGKDGKDDDGDEEEKKKLLLEVRNAAKTEIEERGFNKKMLDAFGEMQKGWEKLPLEAVRALCDKNEGVLAKLLKVDERMLEIETRAKEGKDKVLTLRSQVQDWMTRNKESIEKYKSGNSRELPALELDIRAVASPMTPANTYATATYLPNPYFEPGINDIPRFELTFWDYLTKGRTSNAAYGWVNKTNPQGAAGFIGPGVLKPGISFQIDTQISNAKKVAATDKVALELLEDIDGFESWVKDELRYQVLLAVNTALMSGTSSATVPAGIQTLSVAYTLTTIETTNPTYADALRAVVAQMRAGKLTGPITIFINPIDSANMDMAKATDSGVYMLPAFVSANGKTIAGATVVEDNNIPVGHFQAAFLRYYKILIYKPLYITFGYENDDFTKNLVTYLAEMRLHQIFNTQFTGAFVYDTFANVLAAIAAA